MGGLLDLPSFVRQLLPLALWPILTVEQTSVFPEIDASAATALALGLNASQKNHRSTIQGQTARR